MQLFRVQFIGNLGRDPELKSLPSGATVCNANVAVSEYWTDRRTQELQQRTTWFNVAWWGEDGERAAQKLKKGSKVYIEGTVAARAYLSREGEPRAQMDVTVRGWQALANYNAAQGEEASGAQRAAPPRQESEAAVGAGHQEDFDDDIPF
jgi:single-strand DNA-binding protein